jgi:TetR/AcrR family transcriptional regulator
MSPPPRRRPGRPAGPHTGEAREALLRATRGLLAERGLPRVTVREVAERAGVQPALVSYYFGGKEGMLRAVVSEVAAGVRGRLLEAAAGEGSAEDRIRALVQAVVDAIVSEPYVPRLLIEQVLFADEAVIDEFADALARPHLELIREVLEAGRTEGTLRPVDPMFFMPAAVGATIFFFLNAPMVERLHDLDGITPELAQRFAETLTDLILHGVLVEGGGA